MTHVVKIRGKHRGGYRAGVRAVGLPIQAGCSVRARVGRDGDEGPRYDPARCCRLAWLREGGRLVGPWTTEPAQRDALVAWLSDGSRMPNYEPAFDRVEAR